MAESLTPEQVIALAEEVAQILAAQSQGVGEVTKVTSLDGVYSLPALLFTGSDETVVEAPISLLRVWLQRGSGAIQWKQGDTGEWQNLISIPDLTGPKGETPEFRTGSAGIEWKYTNEEDTAWKPLVSIDQLKLTFDMLTEAQKDEIRFHFSDFTDENKAELIKPAADAAKEIREKMDVITKESITLKADLLQLEAIVEEEEMKRQSFYSSTQAMVQGWSNDEQKRKEDFGQIKTENETVIEAALEAAKKANETNHTAEAAEKVRTENEKARIKQSALEDKAEQERKEAEIIRQKQEGERVQNTRQVILDAENATNKADKAANRANTAAEAAEGIISSIRPDWLAGKESPNYVKNKPEIPTLETAPTEKILSYVNTDGTTVYFHIGDEVRVLEDGEYIFYKLYDLNDGVASWQESGSGTALPGNVYLTGANYYNESVRTIKQGYLSNE